MLRAVNDTAERAGNWILDFHGLITVKDEQKHRKLYPDCKKQTVKDNLSNNVFF